MMKLKHFFYIAIILLVSSCELHSNLQDKAIEISEEIREKMASDSREAIYNIQFSVQNKQLVVRGETSLPKAKISLLSALKGLHVNLVDSLDLLPANDLADFTWALVNLSVVNLRSQPKHSAELVSQAIMGTPVRVLKKQNSWYLIQTPDHYIAWVDEAALQLKNKVQIKSWRHAPRVICLPDFRLAKSLNQKEIVTDLVAGTILKVTKELKNSYELELPDGREITLNKEYCEDFDHWKEKKLIDAHQLTKTAKQFIGRPYLWGGTSSKGVDCSGFVKSVYFMNGIILARDASLQFRHGIPITPQQGYQKLVEGDLIFFGRAATNSKAQKVTHVGMYMANGEYIHSSGRVKINSFDPNAENFNNYRSVSWLGGRHVLDNIGDRGIVPVSEHPWY